MTVWVGLREVIIMGMVTAMVTAALRIVPYQYKEVRYIGSGQPVLCLYDGRESYIS